MPVSCLAAERNLELAGPHLKRVREVHVDVDVLPQRLSRHTLPHPGLDLTLVQLALDAELDAVEDLAIDADAQAMELPGLEIRSDRRRARARPPGTSA